MTKLLVLMMAPLAAFADPLAFGLKGGVPATDAFKILDAATYSADKAGYTVGPMVELHLPAGVSVEFDVLYKPLDYRARFETSEAVTTGGSWEFPLLLKYRFTSGLVRPYVGAGLAWRRFAGLKSVLFAAGGSTEFDPPDELRDRSGGGAVIAGGLEFKALFLRIAPELRYTRWGSTSFLKVAKMASRVNQAEFLVGITF